MDGIEPGFVGFCRRFDPVQLHLETLALAGVFSFHDDSRRPVPPWLAELRFERSLNRGPIAWFARGKGLFAEDVYRGITKPPKDTPSL
jgi:hypothetical protein